MNKNEVFYKWLDRKGSSQVKTLCQETIAPTIPKTHVACD